MRAGFKHRFRPNDSKFLYPYYALMLTYALIKNLSYEVRGMVYWTVDEIPDYYLYYKKDFLSITDYNYIDRFYNLSDLTENSSNTKYMNIFNTSYYVLKNTMVNAEGALMTNGTFLNFHWRTAPSYNEPKIFFDEAIVISNSATFYYGHFIKDFLSALTLVPRDVLERVTLVSYYFLNHTKEFYRLNNLDDTKIVDLSLHKKEFIFVKKLHTIPLSYECAFVGEPLRNLSRLLIQKIHGKPVEPTLYVIYNRPKNSRRRAANYDDLCAKVIERYPEINWTKLFVDFKTLTETGKYWSRIKLIIGPTGSNFDNCIFMAPNTVVCATVFNWFDTPIFMTCLSLKQYLIFWQVKGVKHFVAKKFYYNWDEAKPAISLAVHLAKQKQFLI